MVLKKRIKKSIALALVGITLATPMMNGVLAIENTTNDNVGGNLLNTDSIPVYESEEAWDASGDNSEIVLVKNNNNNGARYQGGYTKYEYVTTKKANDVRVGYHPDFKTWGYWDGYYFSTRSKTSFSPSISLTWGRVSVGVSVAAASKSSGTFKKADGSRRSRPWVRADITSKLYNMYIYDDTGKLLSKVNNYPRFSTTSDIQIFIDYK